MKRRIDKAAPNRGARELLEYVRANYGSIPAFAEAHKLDRIKIQKAISGATQRIDVEFAFDIQRATEGAVEAEFWTVEEAPANDATEPTEQAPTSTGTEG